MDRASACGMLNEILDNVPSHQVVLIDEETTFSDPDEPVRHMNTMIRTGPGSAASDVGPFPNRILDMHRSKMLAWPDEMKVDIKIHPRRRPYVDTKEEILMFQKAGGRGDHKVCVGASLLSDKIAK